MEINKSTNSDFSVSKTGFDRVLGIAFIRTDHPQEVLRGGQPLHREVDVEGAPAEVVPLHRVGVGHDAGEGPHQPHRLEEDVVQGDVVGVVIVGVEGQDAAVRFSPQ